MLIKLYGEPLKVKQNKSGIYDHYLDNVFWKFNNGVQINYKNIKFKDDPKGFVSIEYILLNLEAECYEYMNKIHEERERAIIEEGAQDF